MKRWAVLAVALAVRLMIGFITFGAVDLLANMSDSARVLAGTLADTPYLPFNEVWLWIAAHLAVHAPLPAAFAYKLLPLVFDALIALLLFDATSDRRAAWLYALAPVPIVIMAVHGQWDSQWMYFVLLGLVFVRLAHLSGPVAAGAAIVLAIAAKPVAAPLALFLLPLTWRRAAAYTAGGTAMLLLYIAVLWQTGSLLTFDELLGIVRYAQRGVVLFGLPHIPVPRLWSILVTAGALFLLIARQKLTREEAVLLFLTATMGLSGLAPQYLCWLMPFALLCGRMRFAAIYGLIVGLFLLIYYQLPALNVFNIENMGAWAFLKPLGGLSPTIPDVRWRVVARFTGNLAIPLFCLGYVGFELIRILRRRDAAMPLAGSRPRTAPLFITIALVLAAFGWTRLHPRPSPMQLASAIQQKAESYDVVRYRGAIPPDKRPLPIWIARSYVERGVTNRFLNINTLGVIWIAAWAVLALTLKTGPEHSRERTAAATVSADD